MWYTSEGFEAGTLKDLVLMAGEHYVEGGIPQQVKTQHVCYTTKESEACLSEAGLALFIGLVEEEARQVAAESRCQEEHMRRLQKEYSDSRV